jgi:2-methylisocitrate lyase-like PEP mutase family enzyme
MNTKQVLRQLIDRRQGTLVPGAFNALSARIVADLGFQALYITGAGVTNMWLGLPDQAFVGLHELCEHTARIRDAVDLPLIVDSDTGFGNALNTYHAIQRLERAGADCIQIEDQLSPKRCGHFSGKEVISAEDMVAKIHAACDARRDPQTLIMARTDAAGVHGLAQAIDRANLYAQAGADLLFIEAPTSADEVRQLPSQVACPLLINMVIGGKTPLAPASELGELGFALVLYANAALQGAVAGMQQALGHLQQQGRLDEDPRFVASFAERQRLVNKSFWDELENRYR